MATSRTYIPHAMILAPDLTDTAVTVWLMLRRNPRTDHGQWAPISLTRLATACAFGTGNSTTRRVSRALATLAAAGLIERRHRKTRDGTHASVRCTRIPARTARRVESVPADVFTLITAGTLPPHLLRSWLRWLTVLRGQASTRLTTGGAAAAWAQSVRTVAEHRRRLAALELLWTSRDDTGVSWLRWWGHDTPADTHPSRQQSSGAAGNESPVNSSLNNSSRQQPSAGTPVPAVQTAPRRPDVADAPPAQANPSRRGGRRATDLERRIGRWMATTPTLSHLNGQPRFQCRSALARLVQRLPDVPTNRLLARVGELLASELPHGAGTEHVRIIRAAATQVASEVKGGTLTANSTTPQSSGHEAVTLIYDAPGSDQLPALEAVVPVATAGPALSQPGWSDPDADLAQITAWVAAAMDRTRTARQESAMATVIRRVSAAGPHGLYVAELLERSRGRTDAA